MTRTHSSLLPKPLLWTPHTRSTLCHPVPALFEVTCRHMMVKKESVSEGQHIRWPRAASPSPPLRILIENPFTQAKSGDTEQLRNPHILSLLQIKQFIWFTRKIKNVVVCSKSHLQRGTGKAGPPHSAASFPEVEP